MGTTWLELKRSLLESGRLHDTFANLSDVSWDRNNGRQYEPLLIAKHVDRLSDLIDRCLALRKDIRDLEVLAVKSGAEYDLFVKTSEIDEKMEKLRLLANSRQMEGDGYKSSTDEFSGASTLERGFRAVSVGRSKALEEEVSSASALTWLIENRWKEVRAFQAAYRNDLRRLEIHTTTVSVRTTCLKFSGCR